MKYLYLGLALLAMLILACCWSTQVVAARTEAVLLPLDCAAGAGISGPERVRCLEAAHAAWRESLPLLGCLVSHSYTTEISEALAEGSGLPAGRHEGTYVFLFHNGSWRRDKAESFRITVDGESYLFRNGLGLTDEDTVAAYLIEDAEAVCFEQVAAGKAGA